MRCRSRIGYRSGLFSAALLLLSAVPVTLPAKEIVISGEELPARLHIGSHFVFHESDSLWLNGTLLKRGKDYVFDSAVGAFDLSRLRMSAGDTLRLVYAPLPPWVATAYGRAMEQSISHRGGPIPTPIDVAAVLSQDRSTSRLKISGYKSFRFSARTAGTSEFSQTLDLSLRGELAPGWSVEGAVSDRGYDPSYGTATSRLSELDKINLTVSSPWLVTQIGDIVLADRFAGSRKEEKRISGARADLSFRHWNLNVAAARPRGSFETIRLGGRDGDQGPYQIGEGGTPHAIVPGSETVWLDGERLERGVEKDYVMDYPSGRVTFSPRHLIDSRRRIEIDYEPQATDYRGELYASGAGVSLVDSGLRVGVQWLREGDDREEPLAGDLSEADRELLARVGDTLSAALRSGVVPGGGAYDLVPDSLPDSVYVFVGLDSGQFSVSFSFVGAGKGDYRFVGSERYVYVGVGNGDYQPIVLVPAPQRSDYFDALAVLDAGLVGTFNAQMCAVRFDRNLYSSLDDDDNEASFYDLRYQRDWRWRGAPNTARAGTRLRQAGFRSRTRLVHADFAYDFLLPAGFTPEADERLHELSLTLSPDSIVALSPTASWLEYEGAVSSRRGGLNLRLAPAALVELAADWRSVRTSFDTASIPSEGRGDNYRGSITFLPIRRLRLSGGYEHDARENSYSGAKAGTRYDRLKASVGSVTEQITFERYLEDTLSGEWHELLDRRRLYLSSSRTWSDFTYTALLSHQWISRPSLSEKTFSGQCNASYSSTARRLHLDAAYGVSEETRNARGLTYLEVGPGRGSFAFEDGRYVPDPDGRFIQVEELLSDRRRVRRGEKSFHFSKAWQPATIRFDSRVEEELLPDGGRSILWALPFVSDAGEEYLFYLRRYDVDLRFIPIRAGHAVNLLLVDDRHHRQVAGAHRGRHETQGAVILKQVVGPLLLEEELHRFQSDRDAYFSGVGQVKGYKTGVEVKRVWTGGELSGGGGLRQARAEDGSELVTYLAKAAGRLGLRPRGQLRVDVELYSQNFAGNAAAFSLQLTENRLGDRGAVWQLALDFGIKEAVRLNISLSGRHANGHAARVTARGEMIASF